MNTLKFCIYLQIITPKMQVLTFQKTCGYQWVFLIASIRRYRIVLESNIEWTCAQIVPKTKNVPKNTLIPHIFPEYALNSQVFLGKVLNSSNFPLIKPPNFSRKSSNTPEFYPKKPFGPRIFPEFGGQNYVGGDSGLFLSADQLYCPDWKILQSLRK